MFDNLSERLERSFKILKGEGKITEINVAETLKDVRKALLDADVNYKVAKGFTDTVKEKALGQNVLTAVKPSQLMVKIVHDELTALMGGETAELVLEGRNIRQHQNVIHVRGTVVQREQDQLIRLGAVDRVAVFVFIHKRLLLIAQKYKEISPPTAGHICCGR